MRKKDRVRAALQRQPVDRPPVSLWGHDFLREWSPEDLVAQTIESYRTYDWDFIKLNPRWTFFAEAWGNVYERPTEQRSPRLRKREVEDIDDLQTIQPVDARSGPFAEHLTALRLLLKELDGEVDVVYTLFSPLAVLGLLTGRVGAPLTEYANENPAAVHAAIAAISRTLADHGEAALETGAAGVFFAPLQWTSTRNCSELFYREFGRPYDLQVLQRIRRAEFNILHVCGSDNMLDLLSDYPVSAVNWADRDEGNRSLADFVQGSSIAAMGGIDHRQLGDLTPDQVKDQAAEVSRIGPGVLLTGGCGISPGVSGDKRRALVEAVRDGAAS